MIHIGDEDLRLINKVLRMALASKSEDMDLKDDKTCERVQALIWLTDV